MKNVCGYGKSVHFNKRSLTDPKKNYEIYKEVVVVFEDVQGSQIWPVE